MIIFFSESKYEDEIDITMPVLVPCRMIDIGIRADTLAPWTKGNVLQLLGVKKKSVL